MNSILNKFTLITFFCFALVVTLANLFAYEAEKSDLLTLQEASESSEAFDQVMQVITHKRCMNCHPAGNRPRQGEDSHYHLFAVQRGEDGHGLQAYSCNTCHQNENNNYSGVPGAPHWALAPTTMSWEGKSRVEIATQIMDPQRNGGKNAQQILKHLTEDELVLWAWEPGVDDEGVSRELPPLSKEEWIAAVTEWINNGAKIPAQ